MDVLTARVDPGAIERNCALLKEFVAPAGLLVAVKADGYGHGALTAARAALAGGADAVGVATPQEAEALLGGGFLGPILAWLWEPSQPVAGLLARGVELAVTSPAHARAVAAAGLGKRARVCLKVETGMHRNGIAEDDLPEAVRVLKSAGATITGVMSHLAAADDPGDPATDRQAARLSRAVETVRSLGVAAPRTHLANSAATLTRPDLHLDMVRVGIAAYGLQAMAPHVAPPRLAGRLEPALSLIARVVDVRRLRAGDGVSYGLTWRAPADGFAAVLPVGYADGLPRAAQGLLTPTIRGTAYRQVGRVCMDQIVVWLGDNPHGVAPGDEAVLAGPGGTPVDVLARRLGTISNEIVCAPKGRFRHETAPTEKA